MFLDASSLIAVLALEDDADVLLDKIDTAERVYASPLSIYESVLGLARSKRIATRDAEAVVRRFLKGAKAEIIPITDDIGLLALSTFQKFGRTNHKAKLNMGDCFAYACARILHVPLLFKGNDFRHTDIEIA